MTEYICDREVPAPTNGAAPAQTGLAVATRIFKIGMDKFGTDPEFVLAHLTFLLQIRDENSRSLSTRFAAGLTDPSSSSDARALFEQVIGTFTPQQAKPLWDLWARYEYKYSDFEAVLKLEERMARVYPNGMSLLCLHRYPRRTPSVSRTVSIAYICCLFLSRSPRLVLSLFHFATFLISSSFSLFPPRHPSSYLPAFRSISSSCAPTTVSLIPA
jgi:hypothetical protein